MMRRNSWLIVLIGAVLWANGCGQELVDSKTSSQESPEAGIGSIDLGSLGSENTASGGGNAGTAMGPEACEGVGYWVTRVRGRVEDDMGRGRSGALAQLCVIEALVGKLYCLSPVQSDKTGAFDISVAPAARCMRSATMRVVQPSRQTSTMYCGVELAQGQTSVVVAKPYVVYGTQPALSLPGLGNGHGEEDKVQRVRFTDGLEVDIVPEAFSGGPSGYRELASRYLDPAQADGLCFLPEPREFEGFYGFWPEGNAEGEGFPLRLPNNKGFEPGTALELWILGGLGCRLQDGELLDEGHWEVFGTGRVTADGTSIVADDKSALPCLTWLGYKKI